MTDSPVKKSEKSDKTKTKPFSVNMPHDGYNRVIDEVLDTMDKSIRDVVSTLDLSIFGPGVDVDTAVEGMQPMIISMQDSLIDIIGELEYDHDRVPRDWLRHQYNKDEIPSDALGHFTGLGDVREAMENLADRIQKQMDMMSGEDMDPQKKASIELSIGFITGMIDKIIERADELDNKAGYEDLKNKFGNSRKSPSMNARQRPPRLPAPGM